MLGARRSFASPHDRLGAFASRSRPWKVGWGVWGGSKDLRCGASDGPYRFDQHAHAEQIDHSLHVVGKYLQAHLCTHPR